MTENQLKYLSYQESVRHNAAAEALESGKLDETARSNLAKEAETHRANVARETETNRANIRSEHIAGINATANVIGNTSKLVKTLRPI